ncbi:MAG: TerB family tellurite resistance protein [Alphaproteobacteria bacterium]|nr:TerB family tellurite resistance protein [Alphaproteobacteria bacterium]
MQKLMSDAPELDARAAQTIATAMRMVAEADGTHPRELALIEEFEAGLVEHGSGEFDLFAINTPELKDALLKSLVLVAFADGQVSEAEGQVIRNLTHQLDIDEPAVARAIGEVAQALLSQLSGVKVFADEVAAIGRSMGLDEAGVRAALSAE